MANHHRRFGWHVWLGSAFILTTVFLVAFGLRSINRLWGYDDLAGNVWVIATLAVIASAVNLWALSNRIRLALIPVIVMNVIIFAMPYGPVDVTLHHISDLIYWKTRGHNHFRVADAGEYWLRVAVANAEDVPDMVISVSTEGEMAVTKGYNVKEWNRFGSLSWPANPFAKLAEEVIASDKRPLAEAQQTELTKTIRPLMRSRLHHTHSVHSKTTVYVEYAGYTSSFDAPDIVDNEHLYRLLTILAQESPVAMAPCDIIDASALEDSGLCGEG